VLFSWNVCLTSIHTELNSNTLQHTVTHCNTLQHTATHCNTLRDKRHRALFMRCRLHPIHTAPHCSKTQQATSLSRSIYSLSLCLSPSHITIRKVIEFLNISNTHRHRLRTARKTKQGKFSIALPKKNTRALYVFR